MTTFKLRADQRGRIALLSLLLAGMFLTLFLSETKLTQAAGPVGTEFRVNTTIQGEQGNEDSNARRIAMDSAGNYVIVWFTNAPQPDNSFYSAFFQRYNASGEPQGGETRVVPTPRGSQEYPSVAMDSVGNFVITWTDGTNSNRGDLDEINAQRYNAAGVPQGSPFQVNNVRAGQQTFSNVAMNSAGNFVVSWQSRSSSPNPAIDGIYARRYNAAGVPQSDEFKVNDSYYGSEQRPYVAIDGNGNFTIVWSVPNYEANQPSPFYVRRFNAAGVPQGGQFQVGYGDQPSIASDNAGNTIIAWSQSDRSGTSVHAQRLNAAGVAQGSEFEVTPYPDRGFAAKVATDAAGNFIITWEGVSAIGFDYRIKIKAQRFNAAGEAQGEAFRVDVAEGFDKSWPSVAMRDPDNFVVVWSSNGQDGQSSEVYARQFSSPAIYVQDISQNEGDTGTTNFTFMVALTQASSSTVSVNYATADGTATAPADYTSTSGTVTFAPGETSKVVTVPVKGDLTDEPDETFLLNLSGAVGLPILDNQAKATIVNDDQPANFHLVSQFRAYDSRSSSSTPGAVAAGAVVSPQISGSNGIPNSATGIVGNLTVTNTRAGGYLAVGTGTTAPTTSSLNWNGAGQTVGNLVVAPLVDGKISIFNLPTNGQPVDIIFDVIGYVEDTASGGSYLHTASPARALDTRTTGGAIAPDNTGRLVSLASGPGSVPAGATAALVNLSVTSTSGPGYLSVYPGGTPLPPPTSRTSTMNWTGANTTLAHFAIVPLNSNREFTVYAGVSSTQLIVDVFGYVDSNPTDGFNIKTIPTSRLYDSRANGAGGPLEAESEQRLTIVGGRVGVPSYARAVIVNVTVANTEGGGYLSVYPGNVSVPPAGSRTSIINYTGVNRTVGNLVILPLDPATGQLRALAGVNGTQYIYDVVGYLS